MYREHSVAVVVPAYKEEELIAETIEGIPDWVDAIIVVEDGSPDGTLEVLEKIATERASVQILRHAVNQGLGQSLIDGYVSAREQGFDLVAIMAGDNQMDAADLPGVLDPIVEGTADYVKGNRLLHRSIGAMPTYRFLGNSVLTILTKFATGYYRLMDPQCGYTAISKDALARIPIESMTRRYGYNADILCMLNILQFRVADVEVRPVYDREKSKIKLRTYVPKTSWLLMKLVVRRIWRRYIVRDFHPLVLFLVFGLGCLGFIFAPFLARFLYLYAETGEAPQTTLIILVLSGLLGFQSCLFAIWMDMDYNSR